ncbi:MAG: hypothetical protein P4L53_18930 [Candidatus Obscuribacterales bacterium]|nr:hypothetical protein [Candidatus Obscuribacterales bacterium]
MWLRNGVIVYGIGITILLLILVWIPVQHFVADEQKRQMDVLASDATNCDALLKLGQDHYYLLDANAAIKDFNRVIELEPKKSLAYCKRADAYELINRPDLAKKRSPNGLHAGTLVALKKQLEHSKQSQGFTITAV